MDGFREAFKHSMGPKQQSPLASPNMKQAGQMPQTSPSPFPQSGFSKQGMMTAQSAMPQPKGMPQGDQ